MHRRAEIQGLPICRRSGNAEWRRNSDHSADAGILLRRGEAKASGADGEAWFQAERKTEREAEQSLAESGVGTRAASERRSESQPECGGERGSIESRTGAERSGGVRRANAPADQQSSREARRADVGKAGGRNEIHGRGRSLTARRIRWINSNRWNGDRNGGSGSAGGE